jgi:hypothetical protein
MSRSDDQPLRRAACLIALVLFVAGDRVWAQEPSPLTVTAPVYRTNKAGTKLSPYRARKPFGLVLRLTDGETQALLHEETLRVEPATGGLASDPAGGVARCAGRVVGSVGVVLGAAGTPLPDDLLLRSVWLSTQVLVLAKDGSVKTTYGASPPLPLSGLLPLGIHAVDAASLHVGGVPVLNADGDWVGSIEGLDGPQGAQGPIGAVGPLGDPGPLGDQGPPGDQGPLGGQGPLGDQGPDGDQGLQGDQGVQGLDGRPRAPAVVGRWWDVGQGLSLPVQNPDDMAFDGTDLWVVHGFALERVQPADLSVVSTHAMNSILRDVAFDGARLWLTASTTDEVILVDATDGSELDRFAVGGDPEGVLFDGVSVWVANSGDGTVTRLDASDGALLDTIAVGASPLALAHDGTALWVANLYSNNVTKLAMNGAILGTYATDSGPHGLVVAGGALWVACAFGKSVVRLDLSDGSFLSSTPAGDWAGALATDGSRVWLANRGQGSMEDGSLMLFDAADGQLLETFTGLGDGAGLFKPSALYFDGAYLWASDQYDDLLTRL